MDTPLIDADVDLLVAPAALNAPALILRMRARVRRGETASRIAFMVAAMSVFAVLGFILYVLLSNTFLFFSEISPFQFFWGMEWDTVPRAGEAATSGSWSIWPLIAGTMLIALGAAVIGVPIGLASAIYLSEYASPRVRATFKPVLEVLAGIPSIVFGFFALRVISPAFQRWTDDGMPLNALVGQQLGTQTALYAILVVAIMVLPIITSLSEDALHAVPKHLREASLGMGATKWETTSKVVVPAALSGITASIVLGVARAVGETMAVTLAAGAGTAQRLSGDPFQPAITMTSFIANRMGGDAPREGAQFYALFAVGFTLFALTFAMNVLAQRFVKKYREVDTT